MVLLQESYRMAPNIQRAEFSHFGRVEHFVEINSADQSSLIAMLRSMEGYPLKYQWT